MRQAPLLIDDIDSVTMLALVRLCDNASLSHFATLLSRLSFAMTPLPSAVLPSS